MNSLIEMPPLEKMKMAFSFYAHKFDDKITNNDALTVMGHQNDHDFLLQKDLKLIVSSLQKVPKSKTYRGSDPKSAIKALERVQEEASPERRVVANLKIVKKLRRKNKSKHMNKSKLLKHMNNLSVPIVNENASMVSPSPIRSPMKARRMNFGPQTETVRSLSNVFSNPPRIAKKEKVKGFIEYVSDMYSKLIRIQQKNEDNSSRKFYNKTAMNSEDVLSIGRLNDSGTLKQKNDECRRTLGAFTTNNINISNCFNMYIEDINSKTERDYITFNDFCNLDFNGGYPEIIYDVLY
jgi:hypothetical protein